MTPTERLAVEIESLRAQLTLADERLFWAVAEIARLNAQLKRTEFQTMPNP